MLVKSPAGFRFLLPAYMTLFCAVSLLSPYVITPHVKHRIATKY